MAGLGDKLKELRTERNWTQKELASRSGIKRGYLASVEAGLVTNPSVPIFLKLAHALAVPAEELYEAAGYVVDSQVSQRYPETPEEMIEHLKTVQPAAIPLCRWEDYPFEPGQSPIPFDHIYRSKRRAIGRKMEAYVIHGTRFESAVDEGDVIVVDRRAPVEEGELIACRLNGVPAVGRLTRIAGNLYFQSTGGRASLEECREPAAIIEVRRWLTDRDRSPGPRVS